MISKPSGRVSLTKALHPAKQASGSSVTPAEIVSSVREEQERNASLPITFRLSGRVISDKLRQL